MKQAISKTSKTVRSARGRRPSVFPAHLHTTSDAWRDLKRQEWREVMAALERYNYGSAYTPEQAALYQVQKLSLQVEEALSMNWVAW